MFVQFFLQDLKKRLVRTLVIALVLFGVFALATWGLSDMLSEGAVFAVQLVTAVFGGSFCILYLLGGVRAALWIFFLLAAVFGVMFVIALLPPPWNALLALAVFAGMLLHPVWKKHRMKRQLLREDTGLTPAQVAEIVDTAGTIHSSPPDDIRREADEVMQAGFLPVEILSSRPHNQFLLIPAPAGITLRALDTPERISTLLGGGAVESVPGDGFLARGEITSISLDTKISRFTKRPTGQIQITLHSAGGDIVYQPIGSASAQQIEAFFAAHGDIPLANRVEQDRRPVVQAQDIVQNIREADPQTVTRMRRSRRLNRWMLALSLLSLSALLLGALCRPLFAVLALWPVAVAVFYIRRQEDVMLDGTRQGKPSVFGSFFVNPLFSGFVAWAIIWDYTHFSAKPQYWIAGLAGAGALLLLALRFVRELRGHFWRICGMAFLALAFGAQITALLTLAFRSH